MKQDKSYIQEVVYSYDGLWHVYSALLESPYGWDYMVSSADYYAKNDGEEGFLETSGNFSVSDLGASSRDLRGELRKAGEICKCGTLSNEHSTISVGFLSKFLGCLSQVTWFNQTKILKVYTSKVVHENIMEFIERLIRRTFNDLDYDQTQITNIPTLDMQSLKKPDVSDLDDIFILMFDEGEMALPFCNSDGQMQLFHKEQDASQAALATNNKKVHAVRMSYDEFKNSFFRYQKKGITSLLIDDGTSKKPLDANELIPEASKQYCGTPVSLNINHMLQLERSEKTAVTESLWNRYAMNFARAIRNFTPFIVPVAIDGEDMYAEYHDTRVRVTPASSKVILSLNHIKQLYPIQGVEDYFDSNLHLVIGGDIPNRIAMLFTDKGVYDFEANGVQSSGVMHPRFAESKYTDKKLAIFTNLYDLKSVFGYTHVALFTAEELLEVLKLNPGTDIVIDPGPDGLNYIMQTSLFKTLLSRAPEINVVSPDNPLKGSKPIENKINVGTTKSENMVKPASDDLKIVEKRNNMSKSLFLWGVFQLLLPIVMLLIIGFAGKSVSEDVRLAITIVFVLYLLVGTPVSIVQIVRSFFYKSKKLLNEKQIRFLEELSDSKTMNNWCLVKFLFILSACGLVAFTASMIWIPAVILLVICVLSFIKMWIPYNKVRNSHLQK